MPHNPPGGTPIPIGESGWWDIWNTNPLLGGGEFGGAGGGFGRGFLRRKKGHPLELLASALEQPVALAYGRQKVAGNVIFQHKNADKSVTLLIALGEGEWDAVEVLTVNDKKHTVSDTARFHFHPGIDGELGDETSPATRNQKICSFWPSGYSPQLNFPRTAYIALKLRREPHRPKRTREFEVEGIARARRVRQFDNAGTQTAYAWSANPAWCLLDLLIARVLKPYGAVNEALTSAEKALIDFQAFKDWADFCDADLTINGETVNRFECHLAFDEQVSVAEALEEILFSGRAYLLEKNGKYAPYPDQARASQLTVTSALLAASSLQLSRRPVRDQVNLFRFRYRDLDSGRGEGTISTSGATVTGVDTKFKTWFEKEGAIDLRTGAQKGEYRRVKNIDSDTSLILGSAFSANQAAGTKYGNPARDFEPRVREFTNQDHQDQFGRVNEIEVDLGAQTPERAERLAEYIIRSTLNRARLASAHLLPTGSGEIDLLPGDVLTLPDALDFETTRAFEVMEIADEPDGGRALAGAEYDAGVFVDTALPQADFIDAPDLSEAIAENAQRVANVLKNSSFWRLGVAGQEGTNNARFHKPYSNSGGAPANPTDVDWDDVDDVYLIKTSTSTVDKIGIRTLWNNLGRMFKPGQPVTVAVAVRHINATGLYDKEVKVKIDSDAETYNDAAGNDFAFTIPADTIGPDFAVHYGTFELRGDIAVPDALNAFLWSEATNASKSNFDLEVDWWTLVGGRIWLHFDPNGVPYSGTWNAGASLYDIENAFIKDAAPGADSGGAGEAAGGLGSQEGDDTTAGS